MIRKLNVRELNRHSAETLRTLPRAPLSILLDNVRSGNNVGSVMRTADAFRLAEVILAGITVQPPHRDVLKTSLGAERTVPWQHTVEAAATIHAFKAAGGKVAVVEQTTASVPLEEWRPNHQEPWLIVLGNEVGGVGDGLPDLADVCIEVPQFGQKHSLNISVCAGIVCWHYMTSCGLSFLRGCELS